jgi:NAD(P)-dependent dehydrogenase (short-subunit alcohol dehydrogenase family)
MSVGVVTGAASGMGRASLERLRGEVDQLVAVDVREPGLDGTVGITCDVSDPSSVAALADRVRELGPFKYLVHAAGISPTMADARRILEVNLLGTVNLLDAFEPLVESGSAAVCFSSSSAYQFALGPIDPEMQALVSNPRADGWLDDVASRIDDSGMAYGWSKRGVQAVVADAAVRWGRKGARVNSVSPGLIETPMGKQEFAQQPIMQTMLDATPLGRLGQADELAAVVAFLLSDEASFVSGIDILADGGGLPGFKAAMGL